MDLDHQPAQIGICPHCVTALYENAPVTIRTTHVACAVDAQRDLDKLRAAAVETLIGDDRWVPVPMGLSDDRAAVRRRAAEELVDLVLKH